MKNILTIILLTISLSLSAQKYFTKTGTTEFKASVEAFEPVEAINKSSTAILNIANGDIAALLFIKAFHFEIALMEEHFNENYMDSDKFPKATFKGTMENFKIDDLSEKPINTIIAGTLTIRGVSKDIEVISELKRIEDAIVLNGKFSVAPQDFEIAIPKIVRNKIAKSINVTLHYEFVEKK